MSAHARLQISLSTPASLLVRQPASAAVVPAHGGEITVLPQHTPVLGALRPGVVQLRGDGPSVQIFVTGGYFEVQPQQVLILADQAQPVAELDLAAATTELQATEAQLRQPMTDPAVRAAQMQHLAIARARLEAARTAGRGGAQHP